METSRWLLKVARADQVAREVQAKTLLQTHPTKTTTTCSTDSAEPI